jgi:hypothetical protein
MCACVGEQSLMIPKKKIIYFAYVLQYEKH